MSKIINVLVMADPIAIIRDHPHLSPKSYIGLRNYGKGYIFAITDWDNADRTSANQDEHEGGYCLTIDAEVGDIIRWRMTSLTLGYEYQCFLRRFIHTSGSHIVTAQQHKKDPASFATLDHNSGQSANNVIPESSLDWYWESTVQMKGKEGYDIQFHIVDGNGTDQGGVTIDPRITVS